MKISKPVLYLILVSLAAIAIFILENPFGPKNGDVFHQLFFKDLDVNAIARIEIEHLLDGVALKKDNGQWMAAEWKTELKKKLEEGKKEEEAKWVQADNQKVDMSLTTLQEMEVTSIASANKEKHGFFEVNPAGMQVKAFDKEGKKILHLYIGKTGPAFTESYVRKEGENEVYIANRYLRSSFPPVIENWQEQKEKSSDKN